VLVEQAQGLQASVATGPDYRNTLVGHGKARGQDEGAL
jgi:hypothetical protein